jgi:hypothetical protein
MKVIINIEPVVVFAEKMGRKKLKNINWTQISSMGIFIFGIDSII